MRLIRFNLALICHSLPCCIRSHFVRPQPYIHLYSPYTVAIISKEKEHYKHTDIQCTAYLTNKTIATVPGMCQNYRLKPLALNFCSKLTVRFANVTLGRSKPRQHLTVSILLITSSFIKKLFGTKSNECSCAITRWQASRPYSKTGMHLLWINCKMTSSEAMLPILPKIALAVR